jgi:hypothetical protein
LSDGWGSSVRGELLHQKTSEWIQKQAESLGLHAKTDVPTTPNYVDVGGEPTAKMADEPVLKNCDPFLAKIAAVLAPSFAAMFGKEQTAHVPASRDGGWCICVISI